MSVKPTGPPDELAALNGLKAVPNASARPALRSRQWCEFQRTVPIGTLLSRFSKAVRCRKLLYNSSTRSRHNLISRDDSGRFAILAQAARGVVGRGRNASNGKALPARFELGEMSHA
jgi:hypothetical protein